MYIYVYMYIYIWYIFLRLLANLVDFVHVSVRTAVRRCASHPKRWAAACQSAGRRQWNSPDWWIFSHPQNIFYNLGHICCLCPKGQLFASDVIWLQKFSILSTAMWANLHKALSNVSSISRENTKSNKQPADRTIRAYSSRYSQRNSFLSPSTTAPNFPSRWRCTRPDTVPFSSKYWYTFLIVETWRPCRVATALKDSPASTACTIAHSSSGGSISLIQADKKLPNHTPWCVCCEILAEFDRFFILNFGHLALCIVSLTPNSARNTRILDIHQIQINTNTHLKLTLEPK